MKADRTAAPRAASGPKRSRGAGGEGTGAGLRPNAETRATAHRRELLRQMLLIRRFEDRCVELYSATKIRGFVHLYIGEEAVAVGVNQALTDRDAVVATYREHGHALARGVPAASIMSEMRRPGYDTSLVTRDVNGSASAMARNGMPTRNSASGTCRKNPR